MARRPGGVGLGYLPKGGRAAGAALNAKARPASAPGQPATPRRDDTDVRGSARSWRRGEWLGWVGVLTGSAALASQIFEVLR
jgi:hypothetical protein